VAASRNARRPRFTLALLILTSITLLSLDTSNVGPIDSVRRAVVSVTSPVRGFVGDVVSPIGDAWTSAFRAGDLEQENEELREEVERLRGELASEDSAAATLEQLMDEVDIPYVANLETITGRVVGGPVANTGATLQIDKGAGSGVREGMVAITSGGLVGSVELAAPRVSSIRLVTDPGFRVGVRVDEVLLGVATGHGAGNLLEVELSNDPNHPVERGAIVTTSGLRRSRFPAGVPIGRVVEVRVSDDALTQQLQVEPLASLDALGFVTIVLWEPPA
jgi:rod shape-determining protein MreC